MIIQVKLINPRHRIGNLRNRQEFHRALFIRVVSYIVLAFPIGKPRDSIVCLRTRAKSTENSAFWTFHTEKSDHPGPTRGRGSNLIGKARLGPSRCMWFIDPAWNGIQWTRTGLFQNFSALLRRRCMKRLQWSKRYPRWMPSHGVTI